MICQRHGGAEQASNEETKQKKETFINFCLIFLSNTFVQQHFEKCRDTLVLSWRQVISGARAAALVHALHLWCTRCICG